MSMFWNCLAYNIDSPTRKKFNGEYQNKANKNIEKKIDKKIDEKKDNQKNVTPDVDKKVGFMSLSEFKDTCLPNCIELNKRYLRYK